MRMHADRGTFLLFSGATYINFERQLGGELAQRLGKHTDVGLITTTEISISDLDVTSTPKAQIDLLLAKEHERDHFERYFSSPLGVLIYRCYQVIITSNNWLFRHFFIPGGLGPEIVTRGPLKKWIAEEGLAWIAARLDDGRIEPPGAPSAWMTSADHKRSTLAYLRAQVLPELELVSRFLDVLLHRAPPEFTLGQFAGLANAVFEMLARRGDVPCEQTWTTSLPDAPLHPEDPRILTTTELFELSALYRELNILERAKAPEDTLEAWRDSYMMPPYRAGFDLAIECEIPFGILAPLARTALLSPCDIVYNVGDALLVEALHPTWRFRNQLSVLDDPRDFPNPGDTRASRVSRWARLGVTEGEAFMCATTPIPLPRWREAFPKSGARAVFGPNSNMMPKDDSQFEILDVRRGVEFATSTFASCLAASAIEDLDTLRRVKECIVYFDDEASIPGFSDVNQMPIVIGTHLGVLADFLQLSVTLDGLNVPLPPFNEAIISRLERLTPGSRKNLERVFNTRLVAEKIFGAPFASALELP